MGLFKKKREEKARAAAQQDAYAKLVEMGNAGDVEAQYKLFTLHRMDPETGKKWLQMAADNRHPEALRDYAQRCCQRDDDAYLHYIGLCREVAPELADLELGQTYCGINPWHHFNKLDFEKGLALLAPYETNALAQKNGPILRVLAKAYHAQGNYEKASGLYIAALDCIGRNDDTYSTLALDCGICMLEHTGDTAQAEKYFGLVYHRQIEILADRFLTYPEIFEDEVKEDGFAYDLFDDYGNEYRSSSETDKTKYYSDSGCYDIYLSDCRKGKYAYYTNHGIFFPDC